MARAGEKTLAHFRPPACDHSTLFRGERFALRITAAGPDDADMIILNTCHIRDKAAEKVFSELGRLRLVKQARAEAGQRRLFCVRNWESWSDASGRRISDHYDATRVPRKGKPR